jgi:hypothetical protein
LAEQDPRKVVDQLLRSGPPGLFRHIRPNFSLGTRLTG